MPPTCSLLMSNVPLYNRIFSAVHPLSCKNVNNHRRLRGLGMGFAGASPFRLAQRSGNRGGRAYPRNYKGELVGHSASVRPAAGSTARPQPIGEIQNDVSGRGSRRYSPATRPAKIATLPGFRRRRRRRCLQQRRTRCAACRTRQVGVQAKALDLRDKKVDGRPSKSLPNQHLIPTRAVPSPRPVADRWRLTMTRARSAGDRWREFPSPQSSSPGCTPPEVQP